MFSSIAIADKLLELARARGLTFTPMQLLKLVYIAHGWMLGLYGNPLIRDRVEAWQYGPVIPNLYNAIRKFRSSPVEGRLGRSGDELGAREMHLLEQVIDRYGQMTGPQLSRLTNTANSPWAQIYQDGSFGLEIPNDLIEDHYAEMAGRG